MHFPYAGTIMVYRKAKVDNWGNYAGVEDTTGKPELWGHLFSHELEDATIVPRGEEPYTKAPKSEQTTYSGKTLLCDVDDDVRIGDLLEFKQLNGRNLYYFVEGFGEADFMSPFSGWSAGKEVFVGSYRHSGG